MSAARDSFRALFGALDEASTAELDRRLDAHAAEVRRVDADRLHDERKQYRGRDRFCAGIEHAARLLKQWAEKTTTPAEAAPDFFQVGHTYTEPDGATDWKFRVDHTTTHPEDGERTAIGWRHFRGEWEVYAYGEDDWEIHQSVGYIDATEAGDSRG